MRGTTALRHLPFFLLLAALTGAAYSNSFQVPFLFDDFPNILNKKSIRLFTPDIAGIVSAAGEGQSGTRWLPNLTLAINYSLGGENVRGYHLVNFCIHLCCALVLYLLCLTTLRLPAVARTTNGRAVEIAMAAALLWAVHPLQTNAVTYLVQRMTSLCALFYLAALLCYVRGRLSRAPGQRSALFTACLLFGLMAVTSKENALMLPIMLIGYEAFFLQEGHWTREKYPKILAWAGAILAITLVLTFSLLGKELFSGILAGYEIRNFTLPERLLTESRVIFLYLGLIAYPSPARLNLNHDPAVSSSLLDPPQTALALLGIILLIGLIIWTFNRNRLFSFALFWFLGNLVIESTVVPLELAFEHRLYLPSVFLFLSGTSLLFAPGLMRPWPARAVCLLLACLLAFWTWQRNQAWASEITLWSDVVAKSPGLARGYINLGVAQHEAGNYRTAEDLLLKAIRIDPQSRAAHIGLASLYLNQNRLAEAEQALRTALTKQTLLSPARIYHYLGVMYQKAGNYPAAIDFSRRALHLEKDDLEPLINLGIVYEKLGDYHRADATFAEALRSGLNDRVDLYNNWGITVFKMGQTDKAIEYFRKGLLIDPDHAESHYNLGLAYDAKGMTREALAEMELSMRLRQQQP
jgi:Tfp pilus assembly protein PilF